MNLKITAFPNIDPADYLGLSKASDPILSQKRFFLYASGRAALYYAVKTMNLSENSRVLLPAFHCGVEVEAVKRAGYQLDYYNVKRDLNIDLDDLSRRITDQTRVLVVIHYFGFPQDMDKVMEFCSTNNLLLIEDCAHALYSAYHGRWLGTFGAIGIYSLQKTFGLPNGGGLLCNAPDLSDPQPGRKYFAPALLKSAVKSMLEFKARSQSVTGHISSGILKLYSSIVDRGEGEGSEIEETDMRWYYDVPVYDYHNAISGLSKPLLNKKLPDEIIKKRRINYQLLHKLLDDSLKAKSVIKDFSDGVCPLCYVVDVEDRDRIIKDMNQGGVYPFVFGRFPHGSMALPDFPDTKYLSSRLMGLPVHQQLDEKDVGRVAEIFSKSVKRIYG